MIRKNYGFGIIEIFLILAVVTLLALGGYEVLRINQKPKATTITNQTNSATSSNQKANNGLSWILQYHFLSLVEANPAAFSEFQKSDKIYVILSPKQAAEKVQLSSQLNLIPTVYYNSYVQFVSDYNSNLINDDVKAVIFDDSSDTPSTVVPTVEANNPYQYDQDITAFAHQHGMISMCDFILGKRIGNKVGMTPPCDITLLNYSQQSERSPADFSSVVNQAISVVHQDNPKIPVLVGLSTNPRGAPINVNELVSAFNATNHQVNGYWISIPTSGGVGCPNCSPQNPSLLPLFLQNINQ